MSESSIKKTLFENFILLSMMQVVLYLFPFLTLPYLSRVLGVEKFGLIFFVFAFIQYFIMLSDFGFDISATREIALKRHNNKSLSNIFSSVLFVKFILVLFSFLLLVTLVVFVPKFVEHRLLFLLSFIAVIGHSMYPAWFFQGIEKMKYITFLKILAQGFFVIFIFIFIKTSDDYIFVPFIYSMGFLATGILGLFFAIKKFGIKLYVPKIKSIKKQFLYSAQFFMSNLSLSLYTNTNVFVLGLVTSNFFVGLYVAAEKIFLAMKSFQMPLHNAIYPFISKYKDIITYKKILKIAVFANLICCFFVYCFSEKIICLFYGEEMLQSVPVLKTLSMVCGVTFPSIMIGYPLLGALGYSKNVNLSIIIASLIHVFGLCILFCTSQLNICSIAYMVFITELITLFIRVYFVIKFNLLKD